ncbi:LOW QUALITY PROTEIN: Major facilitator superfamily domain-containing protein 4A [Plecturocebus cupreus]
MGCDGRVSGLLRRNLQPTLTYWSVFFSFGLCIAFLGPTLLDLRCQTHSLLPQISWVFFAQQLCLLLGSALGGVFKRTAAPVRPRPADPGAPRAGRPFPPPREPASAPAPWGSRRPRLSGRDHPSQLRRRRPALAEELPPSRPRSSPWKTLQRLKVTSGLCIGHHSPLWEDETSFHLLPHPPPRGERSDGVCRGVEGAPLAQLPGFISSPSCRGRDWR